MRLKTWDNDFSIKKDLNQSYLMCNGQSMVKLYVLIYRIQGIDIQRKNNRKSRK